jgi:glucans biosynthesis protein
LKSLLSIALWSVTLLLLAPVQLSAQGTDASKTQQSAQPLPQDSDASEGQKKDVKQETIQAFSFDLLTERARQIANQPYKPPQKVFSDAVLNLNYDQHRSIRFKPERARLDQNGNFVLHAFHPGWLFKDPVRLFMVAAGKSMPMSFTETDFNIGLPEAAAQLGDQALPGVAGFRLHYPLNRQDYRDELVSFLGVSYFRALGKDNIYGLSARGIAINTATDKPEEFPRFSEFYIEQPSPDADEIKVWALMEGQSVVGAYAFRIKPGDATVIDVTSRIILRKEVSRLGIAPLTSMFLYAENNRSQFDDYRPQVHDSDGLAIIRGDGEPLWRALNNPSSIGFSYFSDNNIRGFGLMQRDRNYDRYQDTEARYERRPSLWIEPMGNWGTGGVQLIEIPTDLEVNDNIVAFWEPATHPKVGEMAEYRYRMHWGMNAQGSQDVAKVVATRTGVGGTSGVQSEKNLRKFVVDFEGASLTGSVDRASLKADIKASGGEIVWNGIILLPDGKGVRLVADVRRTSDKPIELRGRLLAGDRPVSETWLYQWTQSNDE